MPVSQISQGVRDQYYSDSGGIEWPHDYYGARQFWGDGWNTKPGWEVRMVVLCLEACKHLC